MTQRFTCLFRTRWRIDVHDLFPQILTEYYRQVTLSNYVPYSERRAYASHSTSSS
jgi:hypothetical protein